MTIEMTLNVAVKGSSLAEIQHGLMQAANQSAPTPLHVVSSQPQKNAEPTPLSPPSPPPVPTVEVPPQGGKIGPTDAEHEQAAVQGETAKAARRGRPPGSTKDKLKSTDESAASAPTTAATEATPPPKDVASASLTSAETAYTKDDAIAALSEVHAKVNMDTAVAALAKFNVKRLGELPQDKFKDFIDHCKETVKANAPELPAGNAQ